MTSKQDLIDAAESSSLRETPLEFAIGDTVEVHTRILEGDRERVQIFTGTVIARRGGGTRETFTVRRVVAGEGVERTFPIHSPRIADLVVIRHGRVRRAKLFYLRDRVGKRTRLTQRHHAAAGSGSGVTEDEVATDQTEAVAAGEEEEAAAGEET